MRRARIIVGAAMSAVLFGLAIPGAYWWLATALDSALGFPAVPIGPPLSQILTGVTWGLGLFWILWSYSYLVFMGRGSPVEAFGVALEPTRYLVTAGPYAYVRHPMTLGMLILLFGIGFLANSISGLALVPIMGVLAAAYLRLFEERKLAERFGSAYEDYRRNVPMLIPRMEAYIPPEVPQEPA